MLKSISALGGLPESGTWTPVVTSSAGTITTVGAVVGTYVKIGDFVYQDFDITITTNGTGSGILQVAGSPFTLGVAAVSAGDSGVTGNPMFGYPIAGNKFSIWTVVSAYPAVNGSRFIGNITYKV